MTLSIVFFVIALIFFFLEGTGVAGDRKFMAWGLFSLTLGIILAGLPNPFGPAPR